MARTPLVFGRIDDVNRQSFRDAMGLPPHYVEPVGETLAPDLRGLVGPLRNLVLALEDPKRPVEERLAAGIALSLAGDPRINVLDPRMVDVPGGEAVIGIDPEEVDPVVKEFAHYGVVHVYIAKETPRHRVRLAPFRLGRYPVTNLEFAAFLKATGSPCLPSSWIFGRFNPASANQPVMGVSPEGADAYAAWLSSTTGRRFRLPREAEWEWAAAGPDKRAYPWGNVFLPDRANTLECELFMPTPVGMFPAGAAACDALDMGGNVEEFVADSYEPYPGGSLAQDDLLLEMGKYRVARGGSFCRFADLTRCSRRHGAFPGPLYPIGFRLAETLPTRPPVLVASS